jgi:hypothetical protein
VLGLSVLLLACDATAPPDDSFLDAEIEGAVVGQHHGWATFWNGNPEWFQLHSADPVTASGFSVFISDPMAVEPGAYPVDVEGYPASPAWVVVFVNLRLGDEYDRYVSESGVFTLDDLTPDRAGGSFQFTAALYCPAGSMNCTGIGPDDYPADAPRIQVRGQFRAERDTVGVSRR